MSKRFTSGLESDSSDSIDGLVVRKADKQPAAFRYDSQVDDSSLTGEDTPESASMSSDLSSLPTTSRFPPALGVTTSDEPASQARLPQLSKECDISTAEPRPGGETTPQPLSISASPEDEDLYSIDGLPVLEESIPTDHLPDDLIVHDAHDLPYPVRYVRVTPIAQGSRQYALPVRDPAESEPPRRVAQLHLANDNHIGDGNGAHSTVFRAPLTLPLEAGSGEVVATRVRVIAKTPAPDCGSHRQLHQEARMYHAFPKSLSERSTQHRFDTASLEQYSAHRPPQRPVANPAGGPGGSSESPKRKTSWREQLGKFKLKSRKSLSDKAPAAKPLLGECPEAPLRPLKSVDVPPVVPKFFGYYLLLKPDGTVFFDNDTHGGCDEEGTCAVAWPPAMLLIEDCGDPIQPWLFADAHRWDCYRLLDELHNAGFVTMQPALSAEKMLVQPGPLTVPREARSYANPSFRLVDFGLGDGRVLGRHAGFEARWQEWCDYDLDCAFDALKLDAKA